MKSLDLFTKHWYINCIDSTILAITLLAVLVESTTCYLTPIFIGPFRSELVGVHHTRWFNNCRTPISWTSIF